MVKFLKPGKVVVVLGGRYAGKKAVIVERYDKDSKRSYGHALVAGVERPPRKVTRHMSQRKIARRTCVKPFLKLINYNHFMPTRCVAVASLWMPLAADRAMCNTVCVGARRAVTRWISTCSRP